MPANQFKTDCDCDCAFEWWAAIKRLIAEMEGAETIAIKSIDDKELPTMSKAGWAGDYSATYKWRNKLEDILE